MTRPKSSRPPHGTRGTFPSPDPDQPPFTAVLDCDDRVWVWIHSGRWERLVSQGSRARFVPDGGAS